MGQSIETTAKNNLSAENAKLSSSATRVAEIMSTNLVTYLPITHSVKQCN